ncbi:MAG: hypothetical protein GF411_17290 [Candidatus Lokiarchaeota archaeon]|nr:hypothetical protein [Candidatus Lokiarchaeota archaeon]
MSSDYEAIKTEIQGMVDRETRAWDTKDLDLLMTLWHEDMVWPWPEDAYAHDPIRWKLVQGKFDYDRWKSGWKKLFDTHQLIHNKRITQKIEVSQEGDGAFAVVDIDTLWESRDGKQQHWHGRVCKVYTKVAKEWKIIMHTGALDYTLCKKKE